MKNESPAHQHDGAAIIPKIIVVAGGNGFIGSHVAKYLHDQGHHVRVTDIKPTSAQDNESFYSERIIGNLCDQDFCKYVVKGAHTVLHFAAVMGGMGVIHAQNDQIIYRSNHAITQNLLHAASLAGVSTFFFASSACVYPVYLQSKDVDNDVALKEEDVYAGFRPQPQHLYGLEKLNSEQLVLYYSRVMNIRIGRFHNVYGPRGSWNDGFEKAPAAFLRKSIAVKLMAELGEKPEFEIWGDGSQRRSFLFIDDAVQAVIRLLNIEGEVPPLNIGSNHSISIRELSGLALAAVGMTPSSVQLRSEEGPIGVAVRNSDNSAISMRLHWNPVVSYHVGLSRTQEWVEARVREALLNQSPESHLIYLQSLLHSSVLNLETETIKFAILLPVTSRPDPEKCSRNLISFALSLSSTTWRDRTELCATRFEPHIYLVIDDDDEYLLPSTTCPQGRAQSILHHHGLVNTTTILSRHPKGHVCSLWRDAALRAFTDNCDYYVLMGDDIELLDEGWMRLIHAKFRELANECNAPYGFGCVSFVDITFPGMPTFPVVHRIHMQIFDGQVIPEDFVNQDGDPYLFQLYRHFGASTAVAARLRNNVGGNENARYEKRRLLNWTFELLELGKQRVQSWANSHAPAIQAKLSLDVIVPSYRVNLDRLAKILSLRPSSSCTTMFIIIVDNPTSPHIYQLEHQNTHRMDVRIRVNKTNEGASASRNRGLSESSSEWVAFLDDDVDPSPDYLVAAERHIRDKPRAAGFIGNTYFPEAQNVFTTAVHLAGVTYFWDIADKIKEDIPWGVTANLIVRRNIRDNVEFNLIFPKTGGGEDIDFCRQKRRMSIKRGDSGFWAAPDVTAVHPWWNDGRRSYWRFYMWSKGDGALIKLYPEYAWRDTTPNSAELLLISCLVIVGGFISTTKPAMQIGLILAISTLLVNVLHDAYRHLLRHRYRTQSIKTNLGLVYWVFAVFEGGLIRMASEMGRLVGLIQRREWGSLGKRFDWFTGGPWGIIEERSNGVERMAFVGLVCAVLYMYSP